MKLSRILLIVAILFLFRDRIFGSRNRSQTQSVQEIEDNESPSLPRIHPQKPVDLDATGLVLSPVQPVSISPVQPNNKPVIFEATAPVLSIL